jgi:REP element-mobilizing transposase RayT
MPRAYLLTWTTYGSWLPGDARGSVTSVRDQSGPRERHNEFGTPYDPAMPGLKRAAEEALRGPPVSLDAAQAQCLLTQVQETARVRGWRLLAVAIMRTHVHLVVNAGETDPEVLLRDFKSYGSRSLNATWRKPKSDTWWTESGSRRRLTDENAVRAAVGYVERQKFPLVVWVA